MCWMKVKPSLRERLSRKPWRSKLLLEHPVNTLALRWFAPEEKGGIQWEINCNQRKIHAKIWYSSYTTRCWSAKVQVREGKALEKKMTIFSFHGTQSNLNPSTSQGTKSLEAAASYVMTMHDCALSDHPLNSYTQNGQKPRWAMHGWYRLKETQGNKLKCQRNHEIRFIFQRWHIPLNGNAAGDGVGMSLKPDPP